MRQIWLLLKTQVREKTGKAVILTGIVLIICMISTFSYGKNQEAAVTSGKILLGVANEDASEYARLLLNYFTENETFSSYVEVIEDTQANLEESLQAGELDAYLVIPPMFAERLMQMEHLPMKAVVSLEQPTKALILSQVLEAYESYIKAVEVNCSALYDKMKEEECTDEKISAANIEISLELIFTALGKDEFFRLRAVDSEQKTSLPEHYMLNLLFFFLMFSFLPAGLRVLKLKQNGMLKRLKTLRYSNGAVIVSYSFFHVVFLGVVLCLVFVLGGAWDKKLFLQSLVLFLPLLLFLQLMGILLPKEKDYLFFFSVMVLAMAVLGGGIVPVQYLPDTFAEIAEWMPNYRFAELLGGVMEVMQL